MTGINRTTVMKLLADNLGRACSIYQDRVYRNLTCKRTQCDEIWAFVGAKAKNVSDEKKAQGWGDVWTWTAIDAETKLIPCWYVGTRDTASALHFMHDLADRLAHRLQRQLSLPAREVLLSLQGIACNGRRTVIAPIWRRCPTRSELTLTMRD